MRVYGSENVKTPEQREQAAKAAKEHNGTQQDAHLADEVKRLRDQLETTDLERKRERDQLNEQIEHLKDTLKQSLDQNKSLTTLLTDERAKEEKLSVQEKTLEEVLKMVKSLAEKQKKGWWSFRRRA